MCSTFTFHLTTLLFLLLLHVFMWLWEGWCIQSYFDISLKWKTKPIQNKWRSVKATNTIKKSHMLSISVTGIWDYFLYSHFEVWGINILKQKSPSFPLKRLNLCWGGIYQKDTYGCEKPAKSDILGNFTISIWWLNWCSVHVDVVIMCNMMYCWLI